MNEIWDRRFLHLAEHIAGWSKDPSTKTGAVIVDGDRRIVSLGFNGFPRGVADTEARLTHRDLKYEMILHAEANAILFARRDLHGCTIYSYSFISCSRCAAMVIQSGIQRAVAPSLPTHLVARWGESTDLTKSMYDEAGVFWTEIDL